MYQEMQNHEVINVDIGEKIPHVIWANDAIGRYRQLLYDAQRGLVFNMSNKKRGNKKVGYMFASKIFSGNIKIVKKG